MRTVQSKQHPRLKQLRQALARPGRDAEGLAGPIAGIEGPHLIAEALAAGLRLHTLFVAQGAEALLDGLPIPASLDVLLFPRDILAAALATEAPQPVAALVAMPAWTWRNLLHPDDGRQPLVLVLAALQDPGNLGTIVRSAEAFGATGIVALPGTVSAWNPKTVRASAGSVFRLPLVAADAADCFARLREAGLRILTTAVHSAIPAPQLDLHRPTALIIGNEGSGVPQEIAAQASEAVTIPCPGPVESLNAAVAAGILLYEASRQRAESAANAPERRP